MVDNPQEGRLSRKRKKLKETFEESCGEESHCLFALNHVCHLEDTQCTSSGLVASTLRFPPNVNSNTGFLRSLFIINLNRNGDQYQSQCARSLLSLQNAPSTSEGRRQGQRNQNTLERPPTYPTKYFGCELGAQTNFDMKNERFIVNGEHDAAKLQDILDGFIRKFVLCAACENPETTLVVKKGQIHSKCKACGNTSIIDPKHKLSTFIMKNPPKVDEKEKKEGGNNGSTDNSVVDGEMPSDKDVNGSASDDVDDDWAEPIDDPAGGVSAQIGKLIISRDLDKPIEERLDMLHQYFLKAKADGTFQNSKKLLNEAERLELKSKATLLLADVLFDTNVISQIMEYRNILLRFTVNDHKAQRHLLGGIEQLISKHLDTLFPKSAHIIKALYDNDVVEEEVLLAWGEKPSKKYVKKKLCVEIIAKAQPVLDWLKNAEEDESDDENDEDGAIEFDDRARKVGTVEMDAAKKINGTAQIEKIKTEEDGEVDIDDI
ncbi:eukaryotic translation initiation factor 5, putative [Brugia malayi]|nr:eukaryotic translation initiation factor 5, putative [Brugia malayi]VIO98069.1 eukaryotic translation initiation factor 5, putative [Brugia malayi]